MMFQQTLFYTPKILEFKKLLRKLKTRSLDCFQKKMEEERDEIMDPAKDKLLDD